MELLNEDRWTQNYSLCLDLFNAASEVAYCNGNFDTVERLVQEILVHAKTFSDMCRAHTTKVLALGSSGRVAEAMSQGLAILERLGVVFPTNPTSKDALRRMRNLKKRLRGKSTEYLLRLPVMEDQTKLASMQLLNVLFLYAYISDQKLAMFIGTEMVLLSLEFGLCAISCVGFVTLAISLCG